MPPSSPFVTTENKARGSESRTGLPTMVLDFLHV
jgi:hypothetical protein